MNENDNDNNNNNNNNNNGKEDECLVLSLVYGHSLNIRKRYWWPGTWQCVKNSNELVNRTAFIHSVGILRTDLKDKAFEKLYDSLV